MLAGSVAGMIQDALSSGVIGIGGLAKSIVGFLAGAIGQQFIVTAALPRLVMFLAATARARGGVHGVVRAARAADVPVAVGGGREPGARQRGWSGSIAFTIIESLPGVVERRRRAGDELTGRL